MCHNNIHPALFYFVYIFSKFLVAMETEISHQNGNLSYKCVHHIGWQGMNNKCANVSQYIIYIVVFAIV